MQKQNQLEKVFRKKQMSPPIPPELSFLYATRHLILFYICTKHHPNIL